MVGGTDTTTPPLARNALLATLALTSLLAGCTGGGKDASALYDSFEAALAAPGTDYPATSNLVGGDPTLRLLAPLDPAAVTAGDVDFVFLLYNATTPEPLEEGIDFVNVAPKDPQTGDVLSDEGVEASLDGHGVWVAALALSGVGPWWVDVSVMIPVEENPGGSYNAFGFVLTLGAAEAGRAAAVPDDAVPARDPVAFASYDKATAAPGDVHLASNAAELTTTATFGERVQSTTYSKTYPLAVATPAATRILLTARLTSAFSSVPVAVESVTVRLDAPAGGSPASLVVSNANPERTAEVQNVFFAGTWNLVVTGRALDATYEIVATVEYDLSLKLLDPVDPANATRGRQPFVVLAYDAADNVPLAGATFSLASTSAATGEAAAEEEAPRDTGNGTYTGYTNHAAAGEWNVAVTVATGGVTFEYAIPVTAA